MTTYSEPIAVTGIGLITALGDTLPQVWARVAAGESGIRPVRAFDCTPYQSFLAAEVPELPARTAWHGGQIDRCYRLALAAATSAVADARLTIDSIDPKRAAVILGSALGGTLSGQLYERERLTKGNRDSRLLLEYALEVGLDHMTATFGFKGPRVMFSTACTASTIAIAYASQLLRDGRVDVVLAGGADPLAELAFAGFSSMSNMSPQPCAPFSEPAGLTLGEGAAMLVLERASDARARGVEPRALVRGYGLSSDAYHFTSGDPSGSALALAARRAMTMAGVSSDSVDYVKVHGTGTAANDVAETHALHSLFGHRSTEVPVSSLKGAFGHTLGAAGAVEAAITIKAIETQTLPPIANFSTPRAGCDANHVRTAARAPIRHALAFNSAFGGNNAVLLLSQPGEAGESHQAPPRRVVVTGRGLITPLGFSATEILEKLKTGTSALGGGDSVDGRATRFASLDGFDPSRFTRADLRRMDRMGAITLCAAESALRDSGMQTNASNQDTIGIVVGTALGPLTTCRKFYAPLTAGRRAVPAHFPNTVVNAGAGQTSIHLRLRGPNIALSCGFAAGLAALCVAYDLVRSGGAEAIIAGGVEELDGEVIDAYYPLHRAEAVRRGNGRGRAAPAPLGEGAGFLVLESLDSALQRGAPILAEVLGWSATSTHDDGQHGSRALDIETSMRLALDSAATNPGAVGRVMSAFGLDDQGDDSESRALRELFGSASIESVSLSRHLGLSAATAPIGAALVASGAAGPGDKAAIVNGASWRGDNYSMVMRPWS